MAVATCSWEDTNLQQRTTTSGGQTPPGFEVPPTPRPPGQPGHPQSFGQPQAQPPQPKQKPPPKQLEDIHLDELLDIVYRNNCSDLHLCVGVPPTYRLDGKLIPTDYVSVTPQVSQRIIYDILSDEQIQRFENELELDFSYSLQNLARFRVNVYRDRGNVASAFRLIVAKIPTIKELGLPPVLEEMARKPRGLILVTGPTGSGKSTTLAAMINQINTEENKHILTVEDPIEYLHSHRSCIVNQREVGRDTLEFKNALRAALREDPDVILVGEMRDLDTMQIAITSAETGHLVMGTLHTNSAAESVDRIIDVFPSAQQEQIRVQLSNNLVAIVSQQLLPRADGPGRVCALEIMIANSAIRNLIRESKAHQMNSIIQTCANIGMQTMDQCLRDLYMRGLITYEEALIRCQNEEELKKMIATTSGQVE